jgi:hypothetical protein
MEPEVTLKETVRQALDRPAPLRSGEVECAPQRSRAP